MELTLAELGQRRAEIMVAAEAAKNAIYKRVGRIPKYRRDERVALLDEAEAAYAAACGEARKYDPITPEFRATFDSYVFHTTGIARPRTP